MSGAGGARPDRRRFAPTGATGRAWALGILAAAACFAPLEGSLQWLRFAVAVCLAAFALAPLRHGARIAAVALFGVIALKDGVLVVADAWAGLFHVVLAAALLAAIWRAVTGEDAIRLRLDPFEWALLAPALAGAWSLPASLDPLRSVQYSGRLLLLWFAAIIVTRALRDDRWRRRALAAFALAATPLAVFALVQWMTGGTLDWGSPRAVWGDAARPFRPAGFYLDPNFLGAHLVLASVAALHLSAGSRRWWRWAPAIVLMLVVVVLTYSRSAWVMLAVAIVISLVLGSSRFRRVAAGVTLASLALGAALLGPGPVAERAASIVDTRTQNTTRLSMVSHSLDAIAARPVFGSGLETFGMTYAEAAALTAEPDVTHPHQVPLALVAETGIGGAGALLALAWAAVAAGVRVSRARSIEGITALAGVLALAVGSFFQFFLYLEVAWLFAGLLAASASASSARHFQTGVTAIPAERE